jgi:hypothetical protein
VKQEEVLVPIPRKKVKANESNHIHGKDGKLVV